MIIKQKQLKTKYLNDLLRTFTQFMNSTISSMTPIKYEHSKILSDGSLVIDSKNEKIFNFSGVKTICDFWKDYDLSTVKTSIKRIIRNVEKEIDFNEIYTISDKNSNKPQKIKFKKINLEETITKEEKFKDGSIVNQIIDPYCEGFGIFIDISKPFKDMNFGYNYLHLYEHLMCLPWKNNSKDESNILMNGFTTRSAISVIYDVASKESYFKKNVNRLIKNYFKSRTTSYWVKHKDSLLLETQRTVSETFEERTLHDYFRMNPSVFTEGYDYDVFRYWSSFPMKILIISPKKVNIDFSIINDLNKQYKPYLERPKEEVFNVIPLETLKKKLIYRYNIVKMKESDYKDVIEGKITDYSPGVDVKYVYNLPFQEISSILYPLLIYVEKVNFKKIIKDIILPMNVENYKDFQIRYIVN